MTSIALMRIGLASAMRLCVILTPGLIALFLILRVFINGHVSDISYGLGLLAILAASMLLTGTSQDTAKERRKMQLRLLALTPLIAAIFPFTVVLLIFGKLDMAAFVFHLVFGMEGTPLGDVLPYAATAAIYWGTVLITLYRLRHLVNRVPFWWGLCCVVLVAGNPLVHDLFLNRVQAKYAKHVSLMSEFHEPKLIGASEGSNPDLIIIYLEGLERTYGEKKDFGEIYSPLHRLAATGTSITDVGQVFATGWSLGGTVASQCGVPLMPLGARPLRRMADVKWIAPQITCLTDVLASRGYHSTYASTTKIIGNKMGFYGFDNFFETHKADLVIDATTAQTPGALAAQKLHGDGSWGLRDDEAFAIALDHVKSRVEIDQPYALMLATMDTHGPTAYASQVCVDEGLPAVSTDIANSVRCTARLTEAFIGDLLKITAGRDTRILITSDHLAHRNNLFASLIKYPRRNTVMMLGGESGPKEISRPAAMTDLYPTLLDWMGWFKEDAPKAAGIGRSLLRSSPTLVEKVGFARLDKRLETDVELARHIWRDNRKQ